MPEIGTSGLMSGEGKRAYWYRALPRLYPRNIGLAIRVLQDPDLLARRDDFLVGQAVRLSRPAVAGVWLAAMLLCGAVPWTAPDALVRLSWMKVSASRGQ